MATYYVRTDGNDTTGDGSTTTPWLTISKAFATISAAGGHTILVGDGTYQENTSAIGYLYVNGRNYTDWVTVQPELGAAGDVTIQGSTSDLVEVRFNLSSMIRFKWIKMTSRTAATSSVLGFRNTNLSNLDFQDCTITALTQAADANKCCGGSTTAGVTHSNISFTRCIFQSSGTDPCDGIDIYRSAADDIIDTVSFVDCTVNVTRVGATFNGVTNLTVTNMIVNTTAAGGIAFQVGVDGETGYETEGEITGCTFTSSLSHALVIGAGSTSIVVDACTINGGNEGIVFKECDGPRVQNSVINGGSVDAVYFKAAVHATVTGCVITNTEGNLCRLGVNIESGNKCQFVTLTYNRFLSRGSAAIFYWPGATDDAGGGVCDHNRYSPMGTSKFGSVRGDADVQSLAELRAAWVGYDVSDNDTHSWLITNRSRRPGGIF